MNLKALARRFNRAVFFIIAMVLLQGCSTLWGPKPDIVSENKAPGRNYSDREVRQILIDHPGMLSGDYFRERTAKETPQTNIRLGEMVQNPFGDNGPDPAAAAGLPYKVGLLLGSAGIPGPDGEALVRAAGRALPPGLVLVGPDRLGEVLASAECRNDTDCIAQAVSRYPGVRVLVIAEALYVPDSFPGKAQIRFKLIDANLMYTYPMVAMSASIDAPPEVDAFLYQACRRVMADADRHANVMPPYARVFSTHGDRIYISAGKRSGLAPGAVCQVISGGEAVYAPTGVPVGWVPAEPKGIVRVETLVGEDAAGCLLVEGAAPVSGDYVIRQEP